MTAIYILISLLLVILFRAGRSLYIMNKIECEIYEKSIYSVPCNKCDGACCKQFNKLYKGVITGRKKDDPYYFPYKIDSNGVCEKLVNNKCIIYSDRPLICNIDKQIEFFKLDRKETYINAIKICNHLNPKTI